MECTHTPMAQGQADIRSRIRPSVVLGLGVAIYVAAMVWPPLILLITLVLAKLLPYCYRVNDNVVERRKLWRQFEQYGNAEWNELLQPNPKEVALKESYWVNSRGMCLMTSIMTPVQGDVKAVVCFCHGYMDNASFLKRHEYQRLVKRGMAFVCIEYEGHGRSDGELVYLPSWEHMIQDVVGYFRHVLTTSQQFHNKPVFLMGESMGGAISLDVYDRSRSIPDLNWKGVILCAPMCKISDKLMPPTFVLNLFEWLLGPLGSETWLGHLPIAPSGTMNGFQLEHRRQLAQCVPTWPGCRKPRLSTARELLFTTRRISQSLQAFDAPVLILHGLADTVTDPKLSEMLHNECSSKDKTLKLYEGMMHTLTSGEPDESIDRVFRDVITWIEARI